MKRIVTMVALVLLVAAAGVAQDQVLIVVPSSSVGGEQITGLHDFDTVEEWFDNNPSLQAKILVVTTDGLRKGILAATKKAAEQHRGGLAWMIVRASVIEDLKRAIGSPDPMTQVIVDFLYEFAVEILGLFA